MARVLDVLQGFRESIQDLSDLADMALDDQDNQSLDDVFVEILSMESQLSQIHKLLLQITNLLLQYLL